MNRMTVFLVLVVFSLAGSCGGGNDDNGDLDFCGDPVFSRVEEFPAGSNPPSIITPEHSFWECEYSNERYHQDGSLEIDLTGDAQFAYQILSDFWEACSITPGSSDLSGEWIITEDLSQLCVRLEFTPGIVVCQEISGLETQDLTIFKGGKTLTIQYGKVVQEDSQTEETCFLREES